MKRAYRLRPHRLHPHLRVVADDRLCHPAIERELRVRTFIRRGCQLATGCAVLGLSWLLGLVVVAIASRWVR